MRKFTLDLDDLAVESFATGDEGGSGTVRAFDSTNATDCYPCDGAGSGGPYCPAGTYTCLEPNATYCAPTVCGIRASYCGGCTLNGEFTCQAGCEATAAPQNTCYATCVPIVCD
jgi:hypothetical protein